MAGGVFVSRQVRCSHDGTETAAAPWNIYNNSVVLSTKMDLFKNNLCKLDGTSGGCRCDPDNHNMLPGHSIDILSVASSVSVLKRERTRPFDWPDENHVTRSILSCAIIPKVYSSHRRRIELFIDSQTLTSGLCAQWREYEEMQL